MSEPQTIRDYVLALGASLEFGLRSRRRILLEVYDHLCQAADEELRRGETEEEAQRRAIAAFGSPEEVAARFEAGLLGALDRRLALSARWLHRWTAKRPSRVAVVWMALGVFVAAAVAAVGASFGASDLDNAAGSFVGTGAAFALMCTIVPSRRRRIQAGVRDWEHELTIFFLIPASGGFVMMLGGSDLGGLFVGLAAGALVLVTFFLETVIEGVVTRVARGYAEPAEDDDRQAWSADHPWRAALAWVAPLPLGLLALIVVYPGPGGLRVALAVLVGAMTALAAAAVRLEQSRQEKETYQHAYEGT